MAMIITEGGSSTFAHHPAGMVNAVLVDIKDRPNQENKFEPGKVQHKIILVFQTETAMADGKPYLASTWVTYSMNEKAKLRKFLQSWIGRSFTPEELSKGIDIESYLGQCCTLQIMPNQNDPEKTYIEAVMPQMPGAAQLEVRDYIMERERPNDTITPGGNNVFGNTTPKDDIPF